MNLKKLIILFVLAVIIIVLCSKFLITKNKQADFKNINKETYMKIESNIFKNNGNIPAQYTCDGESLRIPLSISDVSKDAKSLALIVDDPDAPNGVFVHWVIWNISPDVSTLENNKIPSGAQEGYTSLGKPGWVAPCPPSGTHHYYFRLYALLNILSIEKFSTKEDLLRAMDGLILDEATLIGLYERK